MKALRMNWKSLTAFVLFLPVWWWVVTVLPPPFGAVEFAMHMAEEGEHCDEFCAHPTSPIDAPQASASFDIPVNEIAHQEQLIALLPPPHLARDHPPPLFFSLSHSLRAPPTLIPA